jgi:hypothetical protein
MFHAATLGEHGLSGPIHPALAPRRNVSVQCGRLFLFPLPFA